MIDNSKVAPVFGEEVQEGKVIVFSGDMEGIFSIENPFFFAKDVHIGFFEEGEFKELLLIGVISYGVEKQFVGI